MAVGAGSTALTNGTHPSTTPIELAIGLPHMPGTKIHIHLTILTTSLMLFLTSTSLESAQGGATMGSFVYAMPDRYNPSQPLSTPLYSVPSSLDLTTRLAKLLTRRTKKLCYVGGSINLTGAAGGGTVEEEVEAFRAIVQVVTAEVAKASHHPENE
ncbi:hypothetical protein LTR36_000044 [Oleoguttula mirabilis]|uniref:Chorismate-utilising enzyme C-terminal domain-containing protein n=1 Tax=Oleoguttula mirabilis TaxID=1507867 RepID=A0AAV9JXQ5_9PEZI|nr:hypothetical protein LTR36_000044 [Oleoguttula mirabilis]